MATRIRLNKTKIEALQTPADGRATYRDTGAPGLLLVVSPTGTKTWQYYGRVNRRPTRITIGRYPSVGVEQARKQAKALAGQIASGKDPAEARRRQRTEITFGDLFSRYMEHHARPHKRTADEDQKIYDSRLKCWANRPAGKITPADVTALRDKIGVKGKAPYQANRVLALVSKVFNWSREDGLDLENPARGCKRFREQTRDRYLQPREIRRLFSALRDERTLELWRDYFTISLLAGARRSNTCSMRWDDVDLERGLWAIPAAQSKNDEPLLIALHPAVVSILERRREADPEGEFVFPSHGKTGHITEPKTAWHDIRERAGLQDVRVHDLRRSLASYAAIAGVPLNIVGKALGHKSLQATAVYARLNMDPVREAVQTAGDAILAHAGMLPTKTTLEDAPGSKNADEAAVMALLDGLDGEARARLLDKLQGEQD